MGASFFSCKTFRTSVSTGFLSLLVFGLAVGLAGCGTTINLPDVTQSDTLAVPVGHLQGSTYGGQQPIWQSHVYLMKASTSGYKSTSTSILTSTANTFADTTVMGTPSNPAYYVVTNGYGNFDITGDYSCTYNATTPSQSDQLYLVSLGGNATYLPPMSAPTGGATNAYIGLMSVLGQCPSNGTFAGHISFIYMNEVSTVAAAYSLAGFAGSSTTVGSASSSQSQLGLANAFANANQLYDITGSAAYHEARQTTPGGSAAIGGVVPYKLIDTLANVLARCINQGLTAAVPTSGACQTLYTLNGNAPDAASAMIYIAQHPTKNVAALYALQGSTGQEFVDSLTSQPNDFSVGINYVGTSTANPLDIAIDGSGYAWVTSGNGAVLKLTPSGTHATGSPFNLPNAGWVSIDPSGNAWVTAGSIVYEMTPTGGNVTGSPFVSSLFASGLSKIVTDNTGAYVANPNYGVSLATIVSTGNVMRIVNNAGVPTYSTYYNGVTNVLIPGTTLNNIPTVNRLAIGTGSVYVSGTSLGCVLTLPICGGLNVQQVNETTDFPGSLVLSTPTWTTSSFVPATPGSSFACTFTLFPTLYTCHPVEQPGSLAADNNGTTWVALDAGTGGTDQLAQVSSTGAVTNLLSGGGLSTPQGVVVDGAGSVFIANSGNATLTQYTSPGFVSTSTGIIGASNGSSPTTLLNTPTNLDVDQAGNVWVVNAAGSSGSITEFIGLATPASRPLSYAASNAQLGAKP